MDHYRSIVITGGKGMLAHALADQLRQRGLPFAAVDVDVADITKPADVARLFADKHPTLLINCAAYTAVDLCEAQREKANSINGDAVALLSECCRQYNTKLVHYSTDFVFDGQSNVPYKPTDPPHPISAYGISKLFGEQKIQEINTPGWLIIRTAWLYGRHGNSFPRTILKLAKSGRSMRVVNDQTGCPTYTVDLAAATFDLIAADAAGIFHVTNSSATTWYDFAAATLKLFATAAELVPVTTEQWLLERPNQARRPAYSVLDNSHCKRVIGRVLRPWQEALADYRATFATGAEYL